MTGFNDGIEAAAKRRREISHEGLKDSWWRERFESAARAVESLKRPDPSEEEKVGKVAAVIERELMTDEMLLADPTTLRKIKSQRIARAALKAMER